MARDEGGGVGGTGVESAPASGRDEVRGGAVSAFPDPPTEAANLTPRGNSDPINIALKPVVGDGKGFVVARNLGVIDSLEVSLFKLKPLTVYSVYVTGQKTPVASFKTNPMGMANGTAIGPLREVSNTLSTKDVAASKIIVMEGEAGADTAKAVLVGS